MAITSVFGSAVVSLFADKQPVLLHHFAFGLLGLGSLAAIAAGLEPLLSHNVYTDVLPVGLPWQPWQIRLDPLAGLFVLLIGVVSFAVSLFGPTYVREFKPGKQSLAVLGGFTGLFITGMLLVVVADDVFLFMMAWELMSLSSYFLVAYRHEHASNRRAAFLYLLMAHVGGLCILLGFGVLVSFGGGFDFNALREAQLSPLWGTLAFSLAFVGFGMKAGLVPLHVWLPEAHPVAPSHISSLMSGVMLKVAVYGFIRFNLDLIGDVHWGWGVVVLIFGSISSLMGVLYALMQHDLKRLLAYHSVENMGIIFMGLGLAFIFFGSGHSVLGILGLIAALYHTLNHALFKSLLFLGAGAILHATAERDLERMGGLLRRMPWTGFFFLVGAMSIVALPPFNGFVSEWLTYQAALQAWSLENGVLRALIPFSAAVLGLSGALAAACFVKVYGVAFLGRARSPAIRHAREVSLSMRIAQGLLASLCLLLGIAPTLLIEVLNSIPRQLVGADLAQATAHGWLWLTPISAQTAAYSAPWVLLAMVTAGLLIGVAVRQSKVPKVRRCKAWDCGFATPNARMQYTATAFAMPVRRVFGLLFHIREQTTYKDGITYRLQVSDRAWGLFYAPVVRAVQAAARWVSGMQSGNVRIYLAWSLGTLLVLLWLIS